MIHVGFTGTRIGLTEYQLEILKGTLLDLYNKGSVFHHGLCVGGDTQAHGRARDCGYVVYGHPPLDQAKMVAVYAIKRGKDIRLILPFDGGGK